jgi:hypothetical protein
LRVAPGDLHCLALGASGGRLVWIIVRHGMGTGGLSAGLVRY